LTDLQIDFTLKVNLIYWVSIIDPKIRDFVIIAKDLTKWNLIIFRMYKTGKIQWTSAK